MWTRPANSVVFFGTRTVEPKSASFEKEKSDQVLQSHTSKGSVFIAPRSDRHRHYTGPGGRIRSRIRRSRRSCVCDLILRPERLMVLHEHPRLRCRVRFFPDLSACMSITARAGQSTTDRSGTSERSERQLTTLRSGVTARAEEKTGLNFLCIRGIMKRGRFMRVIVPPLEAPAPLSAQNKK
jgi:hypothetical protein